MTQERTHQPMQSEHEEKVAEFEETTGELNAESDPTADPGRPTSGEDLAADRRSDDENSEQ